MTFDGIAENLLFDVTGDLSTEKVIYIYIAIYIYVFSQNIWKKSWKRTTVLNIKKKKKKKSSTPCTLCKK